MNICVICLIVYRNTAGHGPSDFCEFDEIDDLKLWILAPRGIISRNFIQQKNLMKSFGEKNCWKLTDLFVIGVYAINLRDYK